MVFFLEIGILVLCAGIILFLLSLTSYSCRMNVSREKKELPARSGIDYVVITVYNYFSTSPTLVQSQQDYYKHTKQYDMSELRHRKEGGGAHSPHLPVSEKEKMV